MELIGICNEDPRNRALMSSLRQAGLSLSMLYGSKGRLEWNIPPQSIIVLPSPYWHLNVYWSIDDIWRAFLRPYFPESRLVLVGVEGIEHPNYLDLLSGKASFYENLEKAKTLNQDTKIPGLQGRDIGPVVTRFLEGHGGDSVIDMLHRVRRKFQILLHEYNQSAQEYEAAFPEIVGSEYMIQCWGQFKNRWNNYKSHFEILPFCNTFDLLTTEIKQVDSFFHADLTLAKTLFLQDKIGDRIEIIKKHLNNVRQSYVGKDL